MRLFRRGRAPDRFIQLLLQQADYTVQGMQALYDYVQVLAQLERLSGGKMDLMAGGTQ